ncbi:uncharacterized protein LOC125809910 [Solanum verrucosum]|uniref:uncharacterized protein LOC125809910 n=1 Tax=Solanum verrucosum TaxID=315347 RepID=UPI0020D17CE2|nr:uncharacterized protein LOC125809910 [Solanum verrucosum]
MEKNLTNVTTSSEPILSLPITSDPATSKESETTPETIARLEQRITELSRMVLQKRSLSQTPLDMTLSPGVFTPSKAQYIPVAHDATQQVSSVYTYATAPPMTQIHELCRPDVDHYVEVEKEARSVSDELINTKLKNLEDAMRSVCGLGSIQSVRYEELYAFPEVELPPSYKIPKFEKFDGSGNPFFHLKVYCEKLIGVGKNERIGIKLFNQNLSGKALEWYSKQDTTKCLTWDDLANSFVDHYKFHVEIAPDRISITKLKKKSTESFREYVIRWREEVSRAQEPEYYERMLTKSGKSFAEVIKVGDMIEDGIKSGRITSLAALQSTSKALKLVLLEVERKKRKKLMR